MPTAHQACRICGCTETSACRDHDGDPCFWVTRDLCSACLDQATPTLTDAADFIRQYISTLQESWSGTGGIIRSPWITHEIAALHLAITKLDARPVAPPIDSRITLLVEHLADEHSITAADILGHSRRADIALARHEAAWIAARHLQIDTAIISRALGYRHAGAVHFALRSIDARNETESGYASAFAERTTRALAVCLNTRVETTSRTASR